MDKILAVLVIVESSYVSCEPMMELYSHYDTSIVDKNHFPFLIIRILSEFQIMN